jgi:hypothetical protein
MQRWILKNQYKVLRMTVLSYKTSNYSSQLVVRRRDDLKPETKCSPFAELLSLDRREDRAYLRLRVRRDSDFEAYLLCIQAQLLGFLREAGKEPATIIMPFDSESCALRIKIPMHRGIPKARFFDFEDKRELTSYDLHEGSLVAVKMHLADVWTGSEDGLIRPTWLCESVLVQSQL